MEPDETTDLEVFAREASTALARQEDRLYDLRKRALEVIGVASIVFGLFGAFRGEERITWAILLALAVFAFLVGVGVQFSGRKPWYFVQDITSLKRKREDTLAAGEPWNVHGHLAHELDICYQHNQPRIDLRGRWLASAFAALGAIVILLTIDLLITTNTDDRSSDDGTEEAPATTTRDDTP